MTYEFFNLEMPHIVESINGRSGPITIKSSDSVKIENTQEGHLVLTTTGAAGFDDRTKYLQSVDESQSHPHGGLVISSDVQVKKGTKVFGINNADQEHELIGLNEYQNGEQVEVGSETIPLCLNHKETTGWSTKNITVNYKDANNDSKADQVAYISDVSSPIIPFTETPTGRTFNGQQVYARLYTGTAACSAGERANQVLFSSPVAYKYRIINAYGTVRAGTYIQSGACADYPITVGQQCSFQSDNDAYAYIYSFDWFNQGAFYATQVYLSTKSPIERDESNSDFTIVVEYTKRTMPPITYETSTPSSSSSSATSLGSTKILSSKKSSRSL
jgi:hypothetical protein